MELQNSKTFENILNALKLKNDRSFKFDIYTKTAVNEGQVIVANEFRRILNNDRTHLGWLLNYINSNKYLEQLCQKKDMVFFGNTRSNIISANDIDFNETSDLFLDYAKQAYDEEFYEISEIFRKIAMFDQANERSLETIINYMQPS